MQLTLPFGPDCTRSFSASQASAANTFSSHRYKLIGLHCTLSCVALLSHLLTPCLHSLSTGMLPAEARPAGVNRPELLPKRFTPVIDVAGFLSEGQVSRFLAQGLFNWSVLYVCCAYCGLRACEFTLSPDGSKTTHRSRESWIIFVQELGPSVVSKYRVSRYAIPADA